MTATSCPDAVGEIALLFLLLFSFKVSCKQMFKGISTSMYGEQWERKWRSSTGALLHNHYKSNKSDKKNAYAYFCLCAYKQF